MADINPEPIRYAGLEEWRKGGLNCVSCYVREHAMRPALFIVKGVSLCGTCCKALHDAGALVVLEDPE